EDQPARASLPGFAEGVAPNHPLHLTTAISGSFKVSALCAVAGELHVPPKRFMKSRPVRVGFFRGPLLAGNRMQTKMSVEIDRPINEVFDYTTHNVAEWSIIVVKDEVIDEKPGGVGTTFRVTTEENGRRMEFEGLVTRHEPPTAHAVFMKGSQFDI